MRRLAPVAAVVFTLAVITMTAFREDLDRSRARAVPAFAPTTPTTVRAKPVPRRTVAKPRRADPPVPAALYPAGLDVRAGPVLVPLEIVIPAVNVRAAVLGVGVTPNDVMDAPEGPVGDPVWQQAFWYRGSAVPGAISTSLIAGHIDGPRGSSAVFGLIDRLHPGDLIVIHDLRTALDVRFAVTGSTSFPLEQTTDPAVLRQIYGAGPVAGTTPQRSVDGLAHLTLVTCAGTFRNGTHDHRLAIFAARIA